MKYIKGLFLCVGMALLVACSKDDEDVVVDFEYEYVNTEIGSYIIYQVDSTVYNDFDLSVRTNSVQFKEVVEENFKDNLGRDAQRVVRYERKDESEEWTLKRAYYIVKTPQSLEKVEENLRFISFVFPPKENKTWKGNIYIEGVDNNKYLADWEYRFTQVNQTATILGNVYPNTSTILLRDRETVIEKVYAKEVYAKNIGMIFKEWWHLESQDNFDKPWPERAQRGYIIKLQAIGYGKE